MSVETVPVSAPPPELPNVREVKVESFGHKPEEPVEAAPVEVAKADLTPEADAPRPEEARSSERFAALAKKERIINQERSQMRAFAQQIAPQVEKLQAFEKALDQINKDPFRALEMLGVTYEQLTDFKLNNNRPTPSLEVQEVRDEIQALRDQQARERKASFEASKRREQANVKQAFAEFDVEVQDYIKTNAEKYELVATYNETGLVKALVEEKWRTSKQLLPIEKACELAETYLEGLADKALATKKLKAKVQPQPKAELKLSQSAQSRTLNNTMTSSSAPSLLSPKTEADRMQRAMAALDRK